jgi:hypothetical protein
MESYSGLKDLADQLRTEIENYERREHSKEKLDRNTIDLQYRSLSRSFINKLKGDLKKAFPDYTLVSTKDRLVLMDRTDHGASYVHLEVDFGQVKMEIKGYTSLGRIIIYVNEFEFTEISSKKLRKLFKHSQKDPTKYYAELDDLLT